MSRSMNYSIVSFIIHLLGSIFCLVSFATPFWMVPFEAYATSNRITAAGMWMFCFDRYAIGGLFEIDDSTVAKKHMGCYHLFHRDMKKFYEAPNLIPPWFMTLQFTFSLGLLMAFLCTLLMMLYLYSCCRDHISNHRHTYLWVTTVFGFISGYTWAASVIIFGHMTSYQWLIKETKYFHVGWSYIVACFAGGITLVATLFSTLAAITESSKRKDKRPTYNRSLQMANLNNRY